MSNALRVFYINIVKNKKMQKENLPIIPDCYEPSSSEEYMSPLQLSYFTRKLLNWKQELLDESRETLEHLRVVGLNQPDLNDQAAMEAEATIELRQGDRKRKLISKIDEALEKIDTGEYGYCDETGDPIGLDRLKVRPIANLCIEAQERHEKYEQQFVQEPDDELDQDDY
jgi:DnaK suppressor protein